VLVAISATGAIPAEEASIEADGAENPNPENDDGSSSLAGDGIRSPNPENATGVAAMATGASTINDGITGAISTDGKCGSDGGDVASATVAGFSTVGTASPISGAVAT
jgi:hypothetical protein